MTSDLSPHPHTQLEKRHQSRFCIIKKLMSNKYITVLYNLGTQNHDHTSNVKRGNACVFKCN
jgi:hypothetical protein